MNGLEMMSLSGVELAAKRATFIGVGSLDTIPAQFDICQLKEDGWFGWLRGSELKIDFVNRGGDVRWSIPNTTGMIFLVQAEWMFGTSWSGRHHPGSFVAYDMVYWSGQDLYESPYALRFQTTANFVESLKYVEGIEVRLVQSFPISQVKEVWDQFVTKGDYEGLVFRNSSQSFDQTVIGRLKGTVTDEYVLMGMNEGGGKNKGRVGNLVGGMWENGKLVSKVSVGGGMADFQRVEFWEHREDWKGRVFEAYGYQQFPGGSLRHPQFLQWRDDKKSEECVWPHN